MDEPVFCDTPLLRVAYVSGGSEDGAPVLLLHGWPDDATTFADVSPFLHAAGFRTFAPWLRGFGGSVFHSGETMRSGEIAAMAQDALDFADAIGLVRFAVVGHDWGARIAYLLASVFPQRIRCCAALSLGWQPGSLPTPPLEQTRAFWYQWFMATERGEQFVRQHGHSFARFQWGSWSPPGWFDDALFERVARSFKNPDWRDVTLHSYRVRWGEADPDPRYAELARKQVEAKVISVPTLVLHGDDDRVVLPGSSEGKEEYFSASYERELLPGVGHFPTREAPEQTREALESFLTSFGRQ
ncbi:alpha/beta hydrolase [Mesorhizobium sp. CA6]|uniref:alpha/beta fold hydrolase n=1 Tax=Mesorhizobium sp. CA6 TaxID=588500 RepID=UPI001CCA585A|nr:alpha/beta hydrolase [Mesorhizobium sp. CA6]MBZ9769099.1 alpha/beta hydrolase [Mesorhizobium sp. CA6]